MTADLEQLKREAEQEMRRDAPELYPRKRPRTDPEAAAHEDTRPKVGRFEYDAPTALEQGTQGFVITCDFRREMSATREAISVLQPYLEQTQPLAEGSSSAMASEQPKLDSGAAQAGFSAAAPEKPAQPQPDGAPPALGSIAQHSIADQPVAPTGAAEPAGTDAAQPGDLGPAADASGTAGTAGDAAGGPGAVGVNGAAGSVPRLSVVKLAGKGVVMLRLQQAPGRQRSPSHVIRQLLHNIAEQKQRPLMHFQRILPVEATCVLTAPALTAVVAALKFPFQLPKDAPISFAVGYKARLAAGAPAATEQPSAGSHAAADAGPPVGSGCAPERTAVIAALAAGFEQAMAAEGRTPKVDLKAPQVGVLAEALPIAGRSFCAICILPADMIAVKPRLTVKGLTKPRDK